jgi:hypothetical protein
MKTDDETIQRVVNQLGDAICYDMNSQPTKDALAKVVDLTLRLECRDERP